jgi:hypothetical protein
MAKDTRIVLKNGGLFRIVYVRLNLVLRPLFQGFEKAVDQPQQLQIVAFLRDGILQGFQQALA